MAKINLEKLLAIEDGIYPHDIHHYAVRNDLNTKNGNVNDRACPRPASSPVTISESATDPPKNRQQSWIPG